MSAKENCNKKNISNAELDAMLASGQIKYDEKQLAEFTVVGAKKSAKSPGTQRKTNFEPAYVHKCAKEINEHLGKEKLSTTEPTTKKTLLEIGFCTNIDDLQWTCCEKFDRTTGRTMCALHHQAWIDGMSEERAAEVRRSEERRLAKSLKKQKQKKASPPSDTANETNEDTNAPISGRKSKFAKKKHGARGEGSRVGKAVSKSATQKTTLLQPEISFKKVVVGDVDEKNGSSDQTFDLAAEQTPVAQPVAQDPVLAVPKEAIDEKEHQKNLEIENLKTKVAALEQKLAACDQQLKQSDEDIQRFVQELEQANALIGTLHEHKQLLTSILSNQYHHPNRVPFGHPPNASMHFSPGGFMPPSTFSTPVQFIPPSANGQQPVFGHQQHFQATSQATQ